MEINMEKTINLKNDPIFRHAVQLQENRDYHSNAEHRAEGVREALCDLVIQGKLDAVDLKIIEARDCSPMPSNYEVARQLEISEPMVRRKMTHIKTLIVKNL
jgi:hypothetical protein